MKVYAISSEMIQFHSFVKIGISGNPQQRLIQLQSCCPLSLSILATANGNIHKERECHHHFAHKRMRGEWFRLNQLEIAELIKWFNDINKIRPKLQISKSERERILIELSNRCR